MKKSDQLSITGFSTALFSTWYFVEEMGILFDCGDGCAAALLQKSRKIKHAFISHADRDHITGLLQLNQLNGRPDLKIYYPKDSGSFPALADFCERFDPHISGTQWIPICPGDEINVRADLVVRAIENQHVSRREESQVKSLSFCVDRISRKLKPELAGKGGSEIAMMRKAHGEEAISIEHRSPQLFYSGDTPIETDGRYDNAEILIHEATFLTSSELDSHNAQRNQHSSLDQVMQMAAESNVGSLILGHFSSRYNKDQVIEAIQREKSKHQLTMPVRCVLPNQLLHNILSREPIN